VHAYFKVENKTGLSAYLAGKASRNLIGKGPVPNIDVLTSGPVPPNPSELLSSERLDVLINKTREKYDMIILDAPPLGVADSMIMSRKTDGVVLLARAGETRYEMLDKGIKKLHEVSATITGIVLNGFDAKKSGYYYNYSDYYYSADRE
jgi:capsular exopolysaccharide synthesis family protein